LRTGDDCYFVKGKPEYLDDREYADAVSFQAAMSDAGAPTPPVRRTRGGRLVAQTGSGPFSIQSWLSGAVPWPSKRLASEVGTAYGRFSAISRSVRTAAASGLSRPQARAHLFPDSPASFRTYFARHLPKLNRYGVSPHLIDSVGARVGEELLLASVPELPLEWIAGDAHPANTLVADRTVTLVDCDNARVATRVWSIASYAAALGAVDDVCGAAGVYRVASRWDTDAMLAFVEGFEGVEPLDSSERAVLAPLIRLALCVLTLASTNVDDDDSPTPADVPDTVAVTLRLLSMPAPPL
jgi:Ser/Thr protein kinase RdoA (MazF antagonist)